MNSISFDALGVSPALEALRLALSSLSPVEACALTLGWAAFLLAVAHRQRPVVPLHVRLASEAGVVVKPSS
ncbi:hypothetical protein [Nocardiopsis dassonvillei]|uniref:hypothetical protein n=1 Tax=Nocardiopsis dassonvillei TaxID=2014 RepID=UPI00157D0242|nr:hypothetical protein [Nocardiopsis dassonvillei]